MKPLNPFVRNLFDGGLTIVLLGSRHPRYGDNNVRFRTVSPNLQHAFPYWHCCNRTLMRCQAHSGTDRITSIQVGPPFAKRLHTLLGVCSGQLLSRQNRKYKPGVNFKQSRHQSFRFLVSPSKRTGNAVWALSND